MTLSIFIEYFTIAFWLSAIIGLVFYLLVLFFRGKV